MLNQLKCPLLMPISFELDIYFDIYLVVKYEFLIHIKQFRTLPKGPATYEFIFNLG
jgi:hypothetical protein